MAWIYREPEENALRIIFLDIDGVLVNRESLCARNRPADARAAPGCVAALNVITAATNAAIVVSSTWRLGRKLIELCELLSSWGVTGSVVGATPRLIENQGSVHMAKSRGAEIQKWLDQNRDHRKVDRFVILDDDQDMDHLADWLVLTKFETGLTMEDSARAIKVLEESNG